MRKSPAVFVLLFIFIASCSSGRHTARQRPVEQDLPVGPIDAVASWYGSDFHGRPTASGEPFDMHALSCAHKQYPFGTRLKVVHKTNSRAVECVVNDRGPFIDGRDIDLSYGAAKEIGLIGPGISRVSLEVQGRDPSYIKPVRIQSQERRGSPFAIQIGSFTDSANAERLRAGLGLGYPDSYIQEVQVSGATYYRVRVGNFAQFSRAIEVAEQLGQEGYPTLIVKADLKI